MGKKRLARSFHGNPTCAVLEATSAARSILPSGRGVGRVLVCPTLAKGPPPPENESMKILSDTDAGEALNCSWPACEESSQRRDRPLHRVYVGSPRRTVRNRLVSDGAIHTANLSFRRRASAGGCSGAALCSVSRRAAASCPSTPEVRTLQRSICRVAAGATPLSSTSPTAYSSKHARPIRRAAALRYGTPSHPPTLRCRALAG